MLPETHLTCLVSLWVSSLWFMSGFCLCRHRIDFCQDGFLGWILTPVFIIVIFGSMPFHVDDFILNSFPFHPTSLLWPCLLLLYCCAVTQYADHTSAADSNPHLKSFCSKTKIVFNLTGSLKNIVPTEKKSFRCQWWRKCSFHVDASEAVMIISPPQSAGNDWECSLHAGVKNLVVRPCGNQTGRLSCSDSAVIWPGRGIKPS